LKRVGVDYECDRQTDRQTEQPLTIARAKSVRRAKTGHYGRHGMKIKRKSKHINLFIYMYIFIFIQFTAIKSNQNHTMIKDNAAEGQPGHKMALMATLT